MNIIQFAPTWGFMLPVLSRAGLCNSPGHFHRCIKILGVFTQVFVAIFALPVVRSQESDRPNLLFIMTDQQRFDAMSCAGNLELDTPNMDRLAREGVMFENAYSANAICVPSRAIFLTGLSSVNVGVEGNGDIDNPDVPDAPTFDSILKGNDYAAEYYGKWHTPDKFADCYDNDVPGVGDNLSKTRAYQAWLEEKGIQQKDPGPGELYSERNMRPYTPIELDADYDKRYATVAEKLALKASQSSQYGKLDMPKGMSFPGFTTEETLHALDRLKDKTFTLTCSFGPPHPPMVIAEPYYSMFPAAGIAVPLSINDPMIGSPYEQYATDPDEAPYKIGKNIREMRQIYYGMVREVDDMIGEILDRLDTLGLTNNTLVIFTSDHGELLGDHGIHSKSKFYEGASHVPLLMRFPGRIVPGTIVEEPVSTMDVFATILDYMNMPIPLNNGISLRPFVNGLSPEHDVVTYSNGGDYMLRLGDLKLMATKDRRNGSIIVEALYDLGSDPLEMTSKIDDEPLVQTMKERLEAWIAANEPLRVGADNNPPFPNPMTWHEVPDGVSETEISMKAIHATDQSSPVEYFFENITNGNTRDWGTDVSWTDSELTAGESYDYRVRARDAVGNETDWSEAASAVPASDPAIMSVTITSHSDGELVSSGQNVVVTVAAYDDSGIEQVRLVLDGNSPMALTAERYEWELGTLSIGTHTLRARAFANDGERRNAEITIEVVAGGNPGPVIVSPATASPAIINSDQTTRLYVVAKDDDVPMLSYSWTKISGPGTVVFTPETEAATDAGFSNVGDYLLEVTISDGTHHVRSEVEVTVNAVNAVNIPPRVSFKVPAVDLVDQVINTEIVVEADFDDSDGTVELITLNILQEGTVIEKLTSTTGAFSSVTLDSAGAYIFELTSTDNDNAISETVIRTVTVKEDVLPNSAGATSASDDSGCGGCSIIERGGSITWLTVVSILGLMLGRRYSRLF